MNTHALAALCGNLPWSRRMKPAGASAMRHWLWAFATRTTAGDSAGRGFDDAATVLNRLRRRARARGSRLRPVSPLHPRAAPVVSGSLDPASAATPNRSSARPWPPGLHAAAAALTGTARRRAVGPLSQPLAADWGSAQLSFADRQISDGTPPTAGIARSSGPRSRYVPGLSGPADARGRRRVRRTGHTTSAGASKSWRIVRRRRREEPSRRSPAVVAQPPASRPRVRIIAKLHLQAPSFRHAPTDRDRPHALAPADHRLRSLPYRREPAVERLRPSRHIGNAATPQTSHQEQERRAPSPSSASRPD